MAEVCCFYVFIFRPRRPYYICRCGLLLPNK